MKALLSLVATILFVAGLIVGGNQIGKLTDRHVSLGLVGLFALLAALIGAAVGFGFLINHVSWLS